MQTLGANKKGNKKTYVFLCLLITISSSLLNPVLALFLSNEMHLSSAKISLFYCILPVLVILIAQSLAYFSDKGLSRPLIISIAASCGVIASLILFFNRNYLFLMTVGLFFLAIYPVCFPQVFASAREFAVLHLPNSLMYTTFLRSLASLSWVVGPPLAYFIISVYNFNVLFIFSATTFSLAAICSFLFLPSIKLNKKSEVVKSDFWKNKNVMCLFIATTLLCTAFSSYIVSMPLYIIKELNFDKTLPGFMLGLAAFLEIPLMFIAARFARRIGLKFLMLLGAFCLVLYLYFLKDINSFNSFLWIQILPALYISTVGAMGMVFFQELLPKIPGQATSLFINAGTLGQVIGGAMISLADNASFILVFQSGMYFSLFSLVLLIFVRKPQQIL